MDRVPIKPELIRWAIKRALFSEEEKEALAKKINKWHEWEAGKSQPTFKQLQAFAHKVHVPLGYLFLESPPEEKDPIPDFRTLASEKKSRLSPNLIDTISICQRRQSWYRDYILSINQPKLDFVGSCSLNQISETVAGEMRKILHFDFPFNNKSKTADAFRLLAQNAENIGVLVMVSGIVESNTSRKLDLKEFRGFALSNELAPLIFINGADSKNAQYFTLAHELAHLWLGKTALSNNKPSPHSAGRNEEKWCNDAAAELLVPRAALANEFADQEPLPEELSRLAQKYKVSEQVILLRLLNIDKIERPEFNVAWKELVSQPDQTKKLSTQTGGDFYRTTLKRVSNRFARALLVSTLEGKTLYRDAFEMLGIAKTDTFNKLARKTGIMK